MLRVIFANINACVSAERFFIFVVAKGDDAIHWCGKFGKADDWIVTSHEVTDGSGCKSVGLRVEESLGSDVTKVRLKLNQSIVCGCLHFFKSFYNLNNK